MPFSLYKQESSFIRKTKEKKITETKNKKTQKKSVSPRSDLALKI